MKGEKSWDEKYLFLEYFYNEKNIKKSAQQLREKLFLLLDKLMQICNKKIKIL